MPNYSGSPGSSVEGEKLYLTTRQFHTPPPLRCPYTKRKQYRFHLGMRGDATIVEAYAKPNEMVVFTTSLAGEGDRIQGTAVSGWAWKALGPPNVEKCSHTHSGTVLQVSGGCLAQVDTPSREYLNSPEIQARNPAVIQVARVARNASE